MPNYVIKHIAGLAMPKRLFQLLVLAVALTATGTAIVAASGKQHVVATAAARVVAMPAQEEPATLLPTVVVHPDAEVPMLATVTVRPSHTERAAAGLDAIDQHPLDIVSSHVRASSGALLPSGGFDMPYYSFGKTLRRANKE